MATPKKTPQGTWRIQIEVQGVRDSNTLPTRREIVEWAAERTVEINAMATGKAGTIKTLGDALRRYAEEVSPTHRGERWEIVRLASYQKPESKLPYKKKLAQLTTADLADWRDARLKTSSRGTVLRDMGLVRAVLEQARLEWGWIDINPMQNVRRPASPDHREVLITDGQIEQMLAALGHGGPVRSITQAVAVCFLTALATGMRAGELCGLTWENVLLDHVYLPLTKNGKGRDVPLSDDAKSLIEGMRGFDPVLVFGIKSQSLDALFRAARTRAGLSGFTFHDTRHTAATRLASQLHILELCRMFGWSKMDQALTYYNEKPGVIAARLNPSPPTR